MATFKISNLDLKIVRYTPQQSTCDIKKKKKSEKIPLLKDKVMTMIFILINFLLTREINIEIKKRKRKKDISNLGIPIF